MILKNLGESCRKGWHKFEISSEVLKDTYRISAERGMRIGAFVTPNFTPKELKQFTHFVPGFGAIKMTEKEEKKIWWDVRAPSTTKDLGGIGKVGLLEKIDLQSPVKIGSSEIRRISAGGEELAAASFVKILNEIGADLSDCPVIGQSVSGEEVRLLKTENFSSSVVMNETITDRLGIENEASKIEHRYYQSGSLCYNDLSKYGLMTRTIDSLSGFENPPWIFNREMVLFLKSYKMSMRLDPVFQIDTPICEEYLSKWREFIQLALLNPSNYVKFG